MSGVYFQDTFYPFLSLRSYQGETPELLFCRDWLNGIQEIAIKSSGSTGIPKTIPLRRQQMEWSALSTKKTLDIPGNTHLFLCLDIAGIGGLMMLVRAMEWNCTVTIAKAEADPMKKLEKEHSCTFVSLVPAQLSTILQNQESKQKLEKFRTVILGGGPLDLALEEKTKKFPGLFFHSYGMSETCSHIALRALNGPNPQKDFMPLKGVSISLDQDSCLVIEAPSAINGKVETNDIAEIFPDNSFRIKGRKDFVIISGGIKIIPETVESLVSLFMKEEKKNLRFFCAGLPHEKWGQQLALFIEGTEDRVMTAKLLPFLKIHGEKYKIPKAIIFAPAFRETLTGKIDRLATLNVYHGKE